MVRWYKCPASRGVGRRTRCGIRHLCHVASGIFDPGRTSVAAAVLDADRRPVGGGSIATATSNLPADTVSAISPIPSPPTQQRSAATSSTRRPRATRPGQPRPPEHPALRPTRPQHPRLPLSSTWGCPTGTRGGPYQSCSAIGIRGCPMAGACWSARSLRLLSTGLACPRWVPMEGCCEVASSVERLPVWSSVAV